MEHIILEMRKVKNYKQYIACLARFSKKEVVVFTPYVNKEEWEEYLVERIQIFTPNFVAEYPSRIDGDVIVIADSGINADVFTSNVGGEYELWELRLPA